MARSEPFQHAPGARLTQRLEEDAEELGVVDQIAPRQPAGLMHQTERPLEAGARNPWRSASDAAREEVERRADADKDGGPQQRAVSVDPQLLPTCSKAACARSETACAIRRS